MNYQNLNILLIDDMSTVHLVFQNLLQKIGIYNIELSKGINLAWELLIKVKDGPKKIDLILCDWHMPNGNGDEFLIKLRSHCDENLKYTKFVKVTGSDEKVASSIHLGANQI